MLNMLNEEQEKNLEQLIKELSETKQELNDLKNTMEDALPSQFKEYFLTFCIVSTGMYSTIRSIWWTYQRLFTKRNLDDMMNKLDHLPKSKDKK